MKVTKLIMVVVASVGLCSLYSSCGFFTNDSSLPGNTVEAPVVEGGPGGGGGGGGDEPIVTPVTALTVKQAAEGIGFALTEEIVGVIIPNFGGTIISPSVSVAKSMNKALNDPCSAEAPCVKGECRLVPPETTGICVECLSNQRCWDTLGQNWLCDIEKNFNCYLPAVACVPECAAGMVCNNGTCEAAPLVVDAFLEKGCRDAVPVAGIAGMDGNMSCHTGDNLLTYGANLEFTNFASSAGDFLFNGTVSGTGVITSKGVGEYKLLLTITGALSATVVDTDPLQVINVSSLVTEVSIRGDGAGGFTLVSITVDGFQGELDGVLQTCGIPVPIVGPGPVVPAGMSPVAKAFAPFLKVLDNSDLTCEAVGGATCQELCSDAPYLGECKREGIIIGDATFCSLCGYADEILADGVTKCLCYKATDLSDCASGECLGLPQIEGSSLTCEDAIALTNKYERACPDLNGDGLKDGNECCHALGAYCDETTGCCVNEVTAECAPNMSAAVAKEYSDLDIIANYCADYVFSTPKTPIADECCKARFGMPCCALMSGGAMNDCCLAYGFATDPDSGCCVTPPRVCAEESCAMMSPDGPIFDDSVCAPECGICDRITGDCTGPLEDCDDVDLVDEDEDGLVNCNDPDCQEIADGPCGCSSGVTYVNAQDATYLFLEGKGYCTDPASCDAYCIASMGGMSCCLMITGGKSDDCCMLPTIGKVKNDTGCCVVPAEICNDGMDNDGDTKVDCTDPDCAGQRGPQGQNCEPLGESSCADFYDNDGDYKVDCKDSNCWIDGGVCPEVCYGGNDENGNGLVDCRDPTCSTHPACLCGNGTVDGPPVANEQCDDGNTKNCDGCSQFCRTEGCGNRTIECGETCDDGNKVSGDGCSATCQREIPSAVCGNGIVEPGEQCDGMAVPGCVPPLICAPNCQCVAGGM